MTAPFKSWTVLPHKRIEQVTENILTTVGEIHMPLGEFPRRMTVVRLADGRLVIYSAISLDEPEMAALEAFGRPAFLIVPSERHRLDAPSWKQRYSDIWVIAPSGAREDVEKVVTVDDCAADFGDDAVRYIEVPGTDGHEAALEVQGEDGLTLIVNEIIGDVHGAHGLRGWLLERMGFAGEEPQVPAPVKLQFARGREALAGQFRRWAERPDLKRVIVSHGDIITDGPAGVLRKLADSLA
ncbi:MAG: hypothetical protein JWM33_531 [Caulobacteraceae bacterium]|nr:hypothetical protein [Caulobacteraceae bacterium]